MFFCITQVDVFGVFSCGPPSVMKAMNKACYAINSKSRPTAAGRTTDNRRCLFVHHAENF